MLRKNLASCRKMPRRHPDRVAAQGTIHLSPFTRHLPGKRISMVGNGHDIRHPNIFVES